jgi:hypothetical protein
MSVQLSNKVKVSIVTAVCLLGLVVTLKNILGVSAEVLARDVVWFILIYSAFSISYPERGVDARVSAFDKPFYWSLLMVLVTVAIVVVYAV